MYILYFFVYVCMFLIFFLFLLADSSSSLDSSSLLNSINSLISSSVPSSSPLSSTPTVAVSLLSPASPQTKDNNTTTVNTGNTAHVNPSVRLSLSSVQLLEIAPVERILYDAECQTEGNNNSIQTNINGAANDANLDEDEYVCTYTYIYII